MLILKTFAQKLLALGKQQTGLDPPFPQPNLYHRFQIKITQQFSYVQYLSMFKHISCLTKDIRTGALFVVLLLLGLCWFFGFWFFFFINLPYYEQLSSTKHATIKTCHISGCLMHRRSRRAMYRFSLSCSQTGFQFCLRRSSGR